MKKKNLKNLKLNKKSISKLNFTEKSGIKGGSLWYCNTEGLGCYTRYVPICRTRGCETDTCNETFTCDDWSCGCNEEIV